MHLVVSAMFTLSAFADEISPDPVEQVDVLERAGVRHIELRSVQKTNVLNLTDLQVTELKSLLDRRGFRLSAIGSPVGKIRIDEPFEPHLERFQRAIELCRVFGTSNIRVFSYYPPEGKDWDNAGDGPAREVFDRLREQAGRAGRAGVRMLHENEHRIYGDSPARVVRLCEALAGPAFRAVYDPANYVFCGYDPWEGWQRSKQWTAHFHIKDWVAGEKHGRVAGEGQGRIADVMAEAVRTGYDGFATLEPHLLGGGPTGGVTGPDLFPKAADAFRRILDQVGAQYQ
jgi:sugar phosphate isomerase/epimerase